MKIKVATTRKYPKYTTAELTVTVREFHQLNNLLHDYIRLGIIYDYNIDILKATDEEFDML